MAHSPGPAATPSDCQDVQVPMASSVVVSWVAALPRVLASLLVRLVLPFLPAVLVLGFIWMRFGKSILEFMPHYDIDQYIYWPEMVSFASNGFHVGHYGVNELISPIIGFGPHGVGIVMVQGALYHLAPWLGFAAIPVMNTALLTIALAGYVWLGRPRLSEAVTVCLAVALYPPVALYLPTYFQDGLHYSAAVVLAMIFIHLVKTGNAPGRMYFQVFAGVFLLALSFVRYSWAVCFVPYFYIVLATRRWRLPLALALTFVISLATVWFFGLFISSWYSAPSSEVNVWGNVLSGNLGFVLERTLGNLHAVFDYTNNRAASAILASCVAFMLLSGGLALRRASWKRGQVSPGAIVFLLVALNLGGLLAIFIMAWTGNGSHLVRLLSAHYLFCFIVVFHFFPWRVFHPIVAYNAILMSTYLSIFQVYHLPGYINAQARHRVEYFAGQVSPFLPPPQGTNPWDKTIFITSPDNWVASLGLPAGYAIQKNSGPAKDLPRLSRYAVTITPPPDTEAGSWIPLTETGIGTLYRRPSPPGAPGTDKGALP